ncbi:NAD-dependent epimerase/dehydratase family protein [Pseudomonas alkylphenolica]|uniref:NAD-dependent epimerase/dehydratase family protein n=1 Tax=Pseudomonas alkylphenolica TaxID=237609 RepID=UPI0018D9ED17|nr:NAD(P)-dependent oxidoreductase [Pseudomonas alkylphenolica]MBH3428768.1 NAD(P)-dependent oxidoreductase [Pseudomonas alkylphenolica]
MKIALLGATSHIAKDLVASIAEHTAYHCSLFMREPGRLDAGIQAIAEQKSFPVLDYASFDCTLHFDAIINFVGVGDPARAIQMGEAIFSVTEQYDKLALSYLEHKPDCKYIYLSSGAAYGSNFETPITEASKSTFAINASQPQDWYGTAKLLAECRHRTLPGSAIVDVRVFSYFSHRQATGARFFLSDILRALQSGTVLEVSPDDMIRDYLVPADFLQLIDKILQAPAVNDVVDCYTLAPVNKFDLLSALHDEFGLKYTIVGDQAKVNATGPKANYYSLNRKAERLFGYAPGNTSSSGIVSEIKRYLNPIQ